MNYEVERFLQPQNSPNESNYNVNVKEFDLSLIRSLNKQPSVSISEYEADLRSRLEEQTRNGNSSSTSSIRTNCSINEIDSNCSSTSIDIKPKLMIESLRKTHEFDDMKVIEILVK